MGILDKIFRRNKDGLGLDKPSYRPMSDDELGLPEIGKDPFAQPQPEEHEEEPGISPLRIYQHPRTAPQSPQPSAQGGLSARDVDLILSKLDTIRSILTNLDIRLSNLERIAGIDEKQQKSRW